MEDVFFCLFDSETWGGGRRDLEAGNSTFKGLNTLHRHVNKTFMLSLLFIAAHLFLKIFFIKPRFGSAAV